jgi:hypothetical protein
MMKVTLLTILIIFTLACKGYVRVLKHNEVIAADKAVEFAKAAIIERDYEKASELLPAGGRQPAVVKEIERVSSESSPGSISDTNRFERI